MYTSAIQTIIGGNIRKPKKAIRENSFFLFNLLFLAEDDVLASLATDNKSDDTSLFREGI